MFEDVSHWRAIPLCAGQSLSEQQPSLGAHFALHFFMLPQLKPQLVPSQVAVAPVGTGHALHEELPQ